jgi:rod shape-determining protein MreB
MKNQKKMLNRWKFLLSNDIGIDLGTVNTLIYMGGKGIVLNEPSVVAINQKTGRVVAVGKEAKQMLGRTPAHLKAIRPLVSGVISDYEVSEEMLAYFLRKVKGMSRKITRPRVIVGVPSGITNVQSRAVRDAAKAAGAREVHIIEEPLAAAIGVGLPVNDPVGNMVIDMGGGTTDIAVISLGGVVKSRNVQIAGDALNEDIVAYVRNKFQILIGEQTAEAVKIAAGSMLEEDVAIEIPVRGRDLMTGLPREVMVTDEDVKKAVARSLEQLLEAVKEVLETTPPELLSDILKRGIVFVGGGALIRGLREAFEEELEIPIYTVSDPLSCVAHGTGIVLENLALYKEALIKDDDAFEPAT